MRLEWDEAKRAANLAKHGIDFLLAEQFDFEGAKIGPDARRDYGEPRFIALGLIGPCSDFYDARGNRQSDQAA